MDFCCGGDFKNLIQNQNKLKNAQHVTFRKTSLKMDFCFGGDFKNLIQNQNKLKNAQHVTFRKASVAQINHNLKKNMKLI